MLPKDVIAGFDPAGGKRTLLLVTEGPPGGIGAPLFGMGAPPGIGPRFGGGIGAPFGGMGPLGAGASLDGIGASFGGIGASFGGVGKSSVDGSAGC